MRSSRCSLLHVALALGVLGCVGAAAEHETLGDRHYSVQRFGEALVEYRLALVQRPADPFLHAKVAASALHVGNLVAAAEGYVSLVKDGNGDRIMEGADGLERVARAAVAIEDREALAVALRGLQQAAPRRALGSFAQQLALEAGDAGASEDMLLVFLYAAAGARDARKLDSLMYMYARNLRQLGRCEEAVPVYESLMRRQREPAVVENARAGLGYCALLIAREFHVDLQLPLTAEEWYNRVIKGAGGTEYGRRAYLGLGDVLFARGEYQGAAEAYESVLFGAGPRDSLAIIANEKIRTLGSVGSGIP